MRCPHCGHEKSHKHGKTSKGSQRYLCQVCYQTFTDTLNTLYYRRQVREEVVQAVLQSHSSGMHLRDVARTSGLAYETVVSIVRAAAPADDVAIDDSDLDNTIEDSIMWGWI